MPELSFPLPALLADIGGTNARFAVVDRTGKLGDAIKFAIEDCRDIDEALASHVLPNLCEQPHAVVFAVAAAIHGDNVALTNGHWRFAPPQLIRQFGFQQVTLLNDFEALSLSLPSLTPGEAEQIGGGEAIDGAPKLVLGPGTGLGVAALLSVDGRFVPVATEGGHIEFGPDSAEDIDLWRQLWRAEGEPISPEMILSGRGVCRLYRAVCAVSGSEALHSEAPGIVEAGLSGSDAPAAETLRVFASALGRYAGDLALVFLASGGVFIAGGVAANIADALRGSAFRDAFVRSRTHKRFLAEVPVRLITHETPALIGLSELVRKPDGFAINLAGRHWS